MNCEDIISVVCPLYNKIDYLAKTIESVLQQTDSRWELIIVDDGSTDGSYDLAATYAINNSQITLVKRTEMRDDVRGANICRNIGTTLATGKYIMFLDADDLMLGNCIEQRRKYIKKYQGHHFYVFNVAYCKGWDAVPYTKLRPLWYDHFSYLLAMNKRKFFLKKFLKFNLPWHTSGPVWEKRFIQKLGGFDLKFQRLQDPEIHSRALLDRKTRVKCLMYESPHDVLHRKDEDRVVWSKEEFFKKQLKAIKTYIKVFVPLVEIGGEKRYLPLFQGYLLEAEKLVYRHRREGNVSASVLQELASLYETIEYKKISTLRYRVFKALFSYACKREHFMRAKVPGILVYLFKKTV